MRTLITLLIISILAPARAVIGFDKQSLDDSFLQPPQSTNPQLNKKVNFSFHETKLSDVLLLLSKQGDFNVVLPDKYNSRITVQINNQKIIDAIDDIMMLTGLNYQFKSNSLLVSSNELQGQFFTSVPVVYYSAEKISTNLNQTLFEQLIISQDPLRAKPHAAVDPSKNSIILFGDSEQIETAKLFIKQEDKPPLIKIYKPIFINLDDVAEMKRLYLDKRSNLEASIYQETSFVLKGEEQEINAMLDLFKQYDHPLKPIKFTMELFAVKQALLDLFKEANQSFTTTQSYLLDTKAQNADNYLSLYNYLEPIAREEIELNRNQELKILGIQLDAERNLFDQDLYQIDFFNEHYQLLSQDSVLIQLIGAQGLRAYPEIKALLKTDQAEMVLVVLKSGNK